jgi:hypothetical protein
MNMKQAIKSFFKWLNSTGGKEGILTRLHREDEELEKEIAMLKQELAAKSEMSSPGNS